LICRNNQRREQPKLNSPLGKRTLREFSEKSALINGAIERMGDGVLIGVRLLSRSITEIYDNRLRRFGVTAAQFILLSLINRRPITRADIARLQHLERSTLTRNLKIILSKGWVEEVRDNADGRSRPIALTKAGKELLREARPEWMAGEIEATTLLGTDGMTIIINVADHILNPTEFPPAAENDELPSRGDKAPVNLAGSHRLRPP
jgi:DNA-binding MarR family transcriptional regulator